MNKIMCATCRNEGHIECNLCADNHRYVNKAAYEAVVRIRKMTDEEGAKYLDAVMKTTFEGGFNTLYDALMAYGSKEFAAEMNEAVKNIIGVYRNSQN